MLVKPDAVRRALTGEIVARFERRGLAIKAARLLTVDRSLAEEHYAEHTEKPFFGELVDFITSGRPWRSSSRRGRDQDGPDDDGCDQPADAAPGTIRGDLSLSMPDNLVHGSDSPESAEREIGLWFPDEPR